MRSCSLYISYFIPSFCRYAKQEGTVGGDGGGETVFEGTQRLAGPNLRQVAGGIRQVQGGQVQGLAGRAVLGIKHGGVLAARPQATH